MDKTTSHYCNVCFETHEEDDYRWKKMPIKKSRGKKRRARYYCHKGIDCTGCQRIHFNDTYRERVTSRGRYCGKWFNTKPSLKEKLRNMSPEEVVSGGLHGNPNQFQTVSEDYTPEVASRNKQIALEALK